MKIVAYLAALHVVVHGFEDEAKTSRLQSRQGNRHLSNEKLLASIDTTIVSGGAAIANVTSRDFEVFCFVFQGQPPMSSDPSYKTTLQLTDGETLSIMLTDEFKTCMTNGIDDRILISVGGAGNAFLESRTFVDQPGYTTGPDLVGSLIGNSYLDIHYVTIESPGRDPNNNGIWSDYSINMTLRIMELQPTTTPTVSPTLIPTGLPTMAPNPVPVQTVTFTGFVRVLLWFRARFIDQGDIDEVGAVVCHHIARHLKQKYHPHEIHVPVCTWQVRGRMRNRPLRLIFHYEAVMDIDTNKSAENLKVVNVVEDAFENGASDLIEDLTGLSDENPLSETSTVELDTTATCSLVPEFLNSIPILGDILNKFLCFLFGPDGLLQKIANTFM